jgi:hypothetical protein
MTKSNVVDDMKRKGNVARDCVAMTHRVLVMNREGNEEVVL